MNLSEVIDALNARLDTIDGLRVVPYPGADTLPPFGFVGWPESVEFDLTAARGLDKVTLPAMVLAGPPGERSTRDRLARYASGSGTYSVRAVVEAVTCDAFDFASVKSCTFETVTWAGVEYAAAVFAIEVFGTGA